MGSDYDISDNDEDYYNDSDGDLMDTQEDDDEEEEMEMSLVLDSNKPKKKAYDLDYNSLSQASIEETIGKDVDHISGILGVDASTASMLLRHLSWNKEKLIEKYMDNPSAVMVAAGAQLPEAPASTPPAQPIRSETSTKRSTRSLSKLLPGAKASSSSRRAHILSNISKPVKPADGPFTCPVCFDDSPGVTTSSLDCEHLYCTECWQQHLRSKIKDEGEHSISCMAERCTLLASDTFIRTVLKDEPTTLKRYQELLVRNFVDTNPNLKFCPYPSCTNTVSCPGFSNKRILSKIIPTVSCGARGVPPSVDAEAREKQTDETGLGLGIADREHKFCFGCNIDTDHRPVVCSVTKMWMKKCADDSETANWIKGNTKECTKCQSTIEKNGGCNHMTCRKCRHEFCWICLGLWSEHTNSYNCNRYDEKSGTEARDAQSKSRASLERYLHYYNRWANHEQSAKLAADLFAKTERKMQEMQETSSLTWIEVQFMKKAFGEVDKCRGTLKWTYAMAYYLEKGNEKELFEDNQRDLERAVEELSELIEKPIDPETIAILKQQVTDKSVYVSKRNEIMLDDTLNGFLERRWKWNVTVDGFVGSVDDMDF